MKKTLQLFILLAFALTGCHDLVDYGCHVNFNIKNRMESNLIVETERGHGAQVSIIVEPESEKTIYYLFGLCSKGYIPEDSYYPNERMPGVKIMINGEQMPDAIWDRDHWNFTNKEYNAIYTLTITNEFIENIKTQEE